MKLVYAVDKLSFNNKDHVGVVKKVEAQMELFEKNGLETSLCQYVWEGGYPQIQIDKDTDVLYFRRIEPSVKMLLKMRELKRYNSKLRIVMEIPTYPFAAEERGKISAKTRINRYLGEKFLRYYIDRIVLIGQKNLIESLYGVQTICANNGVDFEKIEIRNIKELQDKGDINLICVSGCFFWHGYDRVIEGMHQYYAKGKQSEEVVLHIVGEGECLEEYKKLARKYGLLDSRVFCYGRKVGKELDEIYDRSDIALECFGGHRKNLKLSSSLKSREYVAKGLPIVSSIQLDICNEETKAYIMSLPSDDSNVNMEEIVNFYHKLYNGKKKEQVAKDIRERFYRVCDWEYVFEEVINYLKG